MDPLFEGPWRDPSEDPDETTHSTAPKHDETEAWVTGEALSEILFLELTFRSGYTCCPRCGAWIFNYGSMSFCTFGCPENMFECGERS